MVTQLSGKKVTQSTKAKTKNTWEQSVESVIAKCTGNSETSNSIAQIARIDGGDLTRNVVEDVLVASNIAATIVASTNKCVLVELALSSLERGSDDGNHEVCSWVLFDCITVTVIKAAGPEGAQAPRAALQVAIGGQTSHPGASPARRI